MNPIKAFLCVVCCLSASNGMGFRQPKWRTQALGFAGELRWNDPR